MKGDKLNITAAGGLETRIPQSPDNAIQIQNFVVERRSGGWSTRIGYEPYRPEEVGEWTPFATVGRVYGLHVAQGLAGGAREHVLFCSDGQLNLLYEAEGGAPTLETLQSNRTVPAPTDPGPWFTDTPYGTVVTNGYDRPVIVRPWPAGDAAEISLVTSYLIRPFGFDAAPPAPQPHRVNPMPPTGSIASQTNTGGGATTLWCLSEAEAVADGGRWGKGFKENTGSAAAKAALFGYAISNISDTGSEGPRSVIQSTSWQLPAAADGFRYAVALDVPTGPQGTVARKVYCTANYSEDSVTPNDTTLYFVGLIRNNVDDIYYDAVSSADLGQLAPIVATGPLPAPRARFSAMFRQCLFLDGGVEDPYSLYYSAPSKIEQFGAASVLELGSEAGGIIAIYENYNLLVVLRERGIDIVEGDFVNGFQASAFDRTVNCRGPQSVQRVPGLGLVFLAEDGIYALTGGTSGGSVLDLIKLTDGFEDEMHRITPDCTASCRSVYSAKYREYQLYVAADGSDLPNLGFVLHLDKLQRSPDVSPWSTRVGFPVGAITANHAGEVIFGHNVGNDSGNSTSQRGLFVISGRRTLGGTVPVPDTYTPGPPPTAQYRSAWTDFGDGTLLKDVIGVTLHVMTTGDPEITLQWYTDYDDVATSERTYKMQPPDKTSLPVYGTVVLDQGGVYTRERRVDIRYAVAVKGCTDFQFGFTTTADFVLVGYTIEYIISGKQITRGKRA